MKKILVLLGLIISIGYSISLNNLPLDNIVKIQINNLNLMLPKVANKKIDLYLEKIEHKNKKIYYIFKFHKENKIVKNLMTNFLYKKEIKKELTNKLETTYKNDPFVKLLKKNNYKIINEFYYKDKLLLKIEF